MPLYIMYFNLKDGVSEEEFVKKSKELSDYLEGKVEGLGSVKLYRHHFIGTDQVRIYQMHNEFEDFGTWDRFTDLRRTLRLQESWRNGKTSSTSIHTLMNLFVKYPFKLSSEHSLAV